MIDMITIVIIETALLALFIGCWLSGNWKIREVVEIERCAYDVYYSGGGPRGQETRIVYQVTYWSGRMKFKTEKYSH